MSCPQNVFFFQAIITCERNLCSFLLSTPAGNPCISPSPSLELWTNFPATHDNQRGSQLWPCTLSVLPSPACMHFNFPFCVCDPCTLHYLPSGHQEVDVPVLSSSSLAGQVASQVITENSSHTHCCRSLCTSQCPTGAQLSWDFLPKDCPWGAVGKLAGLGITSSAN